MASAYQRRQRTVAATSTLRLSLIGLPTSRVSSRASSSAASATSSAKRNSTRLRSAGGRSAQSPRSKAARAAATAASTSTESQAATAASLRPSIGLMQSNVAPERAGVSAPLMSARPPGCTARARACQLAASDAWLRSFIGAPIWRCDQTLSNGWPTRLPGWQSTPRRGRSSTPGQLKSGGCRTGGRIMLKQIQSILNSLLTGALVSLNLASPGTPRST